MGEGALPGGIFRQSAPGELEINIPGVVESPTNAIIRNAYSTKSRHKGESTTKTIDGGVYPRGFTPPVDYIVDPTYNRASENLTMDSEELSRGKLLLLQDIPDQLGFYPDLNSKTPRRQSEAYLKLQESPLRFFDTPSVQFRHLLEYQDTTNLQNLQNPIVVGTDGNRPGLSYEFNEFNGEFIDPGKKGFNAQYLASFVRTHRENEDPTLLGFDFHVRLSNSPLFNGTLEEFLVTYGKDNIELKNRIELLKEFQKQFLNFFKSYDPNHLSENLSSVGFFSDYNNSSSDGSNSAQVSGTSEKSGQITSGLLKDLDPSKDVKDTYLGSSAKAYYVQNISGLGKLNESNDYGDGGQRFVKWGSDFLTITVNEDVSQNMGYLASLYKNLAWSREKGRLAVPENLLRFEVVLDITEIRNYVRMYKNGAESAKNFASSLLPPEDTSWIEIADQTSKYRYFVHDCQFFFPGMPHGDTLTNAPQEAVKGLDIKIYFKNSNLRFMKFGAPLNVKTMNDDYSSYNGRYRTNSLEDYDDYFRVKVVDNSVAYVGDVQGDLNIKNGAPTTARKTIWDNGNLEPTSNNTAPIGYPLEIFDDMLSKQKDNVNTNNMMDDLYRRRAINKQLNFSDKVKIGAKDALKSIKRAAFNATVNSFNRQVISLASLVNRTLNQIYNSTPVVGGIKPPKNIYERPDKYEQAYIDFIGPGLRTFFEDPIKFRKEGELSTLQQKVGDNPNVLGDKLVGSVPVRDNNFFSPDVDYGNAARRTNGNKTLDKIVEEDVKFGDPKADVTESIFDRDVTFFSFDPNRGNSGTKGVNKSLNDIVDGDVDNFGNQSAQTTGEVNGTDATFFSSVPDRGNSAKFDKSNKKLNELVSEDVDFGNENADTTATVDGRNVNFFSSVPSRGNSARFSTGNKTLNEIVGEDVDFGSSTADTTETIDGRNVNFFSDDPTRGNSGTRVGSNQTLDEIVGEDGDFGSSTADTTATVDGRNVNFFSANPDRGNSATFKKKNKKLDELVSDDVDFGDSGADISSTINGIEATFFSTDPKSGNSGTRTIRTPKTLQEIVDSDPALGNGGNISNIPSLGNSGQSGDNLQNNLVVSQNSQVVNPSLGNSGLVGNNTSNDSTVIQNTILEDPSEGNSALTGTSTPNDSVVLINTLLENPDEGNSALTGANTPNDKLVSSLTKVENPSEGNSALTGANTPNDKLVSSLTKVENSAEGNSALVGANTTNDKLVLSKSKVTNPDSSNSAQFGKNQKTDDLISKQSKLETKDQGNSAQLGINRKTDSLLESKSTLENSGIGNSSQQGRNSLNNFTIESNSQVQNTSLGNSALTGNNLKQQEIVDNRSNLQYGELGNSATNGKNVSVDDKINKNTSLDNASQGNSGILGNNSTTDTIVNNRTSLNEPEMGNSGSMGPNKTVEQRISNYSNLDKSDIGNSAQSGKNKTTDEIIEKQSKVENPDQANSATFGKNKNLSDFMRYSNSRVYGSVDWNNIQFPRSGNRLP